MNCFLCGGTTRLYLHKDFGGQYGLGLCTYVLCEKCGMMISQTRRDMTDAQWLELNRCFHSQSMSSFDYGWLDRMKNHAEAFKLLRDAGVMPSKRPWLDWGCGSGAFLEQLNKIAPSAGYDKYARPDGATLSVGAFDVVCLISVIEHIMDMKTLDDVAALVSGDGCLAVHTLVEDQFPCEPTHYYLLASHCSFWTKRAMRIACKRWGFACTLRNRGLQIDIMFRKDDGSQKAFAEAHPHVWAYGKGYDGE